MRIRLLGSGHASNILAELNLCRQSRRYCDVMLNVGNRTFAAHSAVLACAGSYFRNLVSQMAPSTTATFTLQFITSASFEKLLTFVYTGEILTDLMEVGVLYELAERLGVQELVKACHATFPDLQASASGIGKSSSSGNINLDSNGMLNVSSISAPSLCSSSSSSAAPTPSDAPSLHAYQSTAIGLQHESLDLKTEDVQAVIGYGETREGQLLHNQSDGSLQLKTEPEDISGDPPMVSFSLSDSSPQLQAFVSAASSASGLRGAMAGERTDNTQMFREEKENLQSDMMEEALEEIIELSDDENFMEEDEDLVFVENGDDTSSQETGSALSCKACGVLLLEEPATIGEHAQSHLSELGVCRLCGAAFPDRATAVAHALMHVGVRLHACDMCGLQCCTRGKLLRHIRQAQAAEYSEPQGALAGGSNHELRCAVCNQTLSKTFQAVKDHVLLHVRPQTLSCRVCARSLPSLCMLLWHGLAHLHVPVYTCARCGRGFAQRPLLDAHIRTHTDEESSQQSLRISGKRKAELPLVGRPSSSSSSSPRDVNKPGSAPRYRCRYCGKTFAHSGEFTYHLRIHTGEKPYQCRVCLRLFRGRSTIISHLKTHGGALMYRCTVCGSFFSTLKLITSHMELHEHLLPPDFHIEQTFMYNDRSKEPLGASDA